MTKIRTLSLTELKQNEEGVVKTLNGGKAFKQKLNSMGIRTGKKITKISNMVMNGPVTVRVGNTNIAIGRGMADRIQIKIYVD